MPDFDSVPALWEFGGYFCGLESGYFLGVGDGRSVMDLRRMCLRKTPSRPLCGKPYLASDGIAHDLGREVLSPKLHTVLHTEHAEATLDRR